MAKTYPILPNDKHLLNSTLSRQWLAVDAYFSLSLTIPNNV